MKRNNQTTPPSKTQRRTLQRITGNDSPVIASPPAQQNLIPPNAPNTDSPVAMQREPQLIFFSPGPPPSPPEKKKRKTRHHGIHGGCKPTSYKRILDFDDPDNNDLYLAPPAPKLEI